VKLIVCVIGSGKRATLYLIEIFILKKLGWKIERKIPLGTPSYKYRRIILKVITKRNVGLDWIALDWIGLDLVAGFRFTKSLAFYGPEGSLPIFTTASH
jgi:hypothetical protein